MESVHKETESLTPKKKPSVQIKNGWDDNKHKGVHPSPADNVAEPSIPGVPMTDEADSAAQQPAVAERPIGEETPEKSVMPPGQVTPGEPTTPGAEATESSPAVASAPVAATQDEDEKKIAAVPMVQPVSPATGGMSSPPSEQTAEPSSTEKKSTVKYGAAIPVGGGRFVPVGTGATGGAASQSKIDFQAEKDKIEAEFTKLEEQLDSGARAREDIEKDFDALTQKAATLRRLQEADAAANRAQIAQRPAPLAPVRVAQLQAPRDPAIPSMAVVHWKGVTKPQFLEYREKLHAKYGKEKSDIKSVERIPNRILITAPNPTIMQQILADEELDPRPEPYKLPSSAAPKPAAVLKPPVKLGALGEPAPLKLGALSEPANGSSLPPVQPHSSGGLPVPNKPELPAVVPGALAQPQ